MPNRQREHDHAINLHLMFGQQRERWRILCERIADEEDPDRFSKLVQELLAELEAKDKRLKSGIKLTPKPTQSE